MTSAKPALDRTDAKLIGVIADSHSREKGATDLPQQVLDALDGVELILHLGDMGVVASLDRLAEVAPVLALRGAHAVGTHARMVTGTRRIECAVHAIGAVFDLAGCAPTVRVDPKLELDGDKSPDQIASAFGGPVAVVAHAMTHRARVERHCGMLFVNPGSPTLPAEGEGTLAIVDLSEPEPQARIETL